MFHKSNVDSIYNLKLFLLKNTDLEFFDSDYNVYKTSHDSVNLRCTTCKKEFKKKITEIKALNCSCKYCSDGISKSEKILSYVLSQTNINYEFQKIFDWNVNKRYDCYIPSMDMIVEVHGGQHYKNNDYFKHSLSYIKKNDKKKKELAFLNGIKLYLEIDCNCTPSEMVANIIKELSPYFNLSNIDLSNINYVINKNKSKDVLYFWNKGMTSSEISKLTKISRKSVCETLTELKKLGVCNNYSFSECIIRTYSRHGEKLCKFDNDGCILQCFRTVSCASKSTGLSNLNIRNEIKNNSLILKWVSDDEIPSLIFNEITK